MTTPANFLPSLEVKVYDERGKEQRCDKELVLAEILRFSGKVYIALQIE